MSTKKNSGRKNPMKKNDSIETFSKETYSIGELAMMTGFTTRTLRSHIKNGLLKGEKVGGAYAFDEGETQRFLSMPDINRKLLQKNAAIAEDFLTHPNLKGSRLCVMLDLETDVAVRRKTVAYFCEAASRIEKDIRFSAQMHGKRIRVVLEGREQDVCTIMKGYYEDVR